MGKASKADDDNSLCPCGSGALAAACCEPLLAGRQQALTAAALMRSRYVAFVRGDSDYLLRTWHPRTRPAQLTLDPAQRWLGLKIKREVAGGAQDAVGQVEFVARYKLGSRGYALRELSAFERTQGRWLYVAGEHD